MHSGCGSKSYLEREKLKERLCQSDSKPVTKHKKCKETCLIILDHSVIGENIYDTFVSKM